MKPNSIHKRPAMQIYRQTDSLRNRLRVNLNDLTLVADQSRSDSPDKSSVLLPNGSNLANLP